MKYLLIIILGLCLLTSCGGVKDIVVTDLNTIGKVIDIQPNKDGCGMYKYTVEISPDLIIYYITNKEYEYDEMVKIEATIKLLD